MRRFHFWHRFCPAAWRPGFPHAHAGARRTAAFSSRPSGEHSARSGPWPRRPLGLPVPVPGHAGPSGGPSLASPAVSWTVPTPSSSSPSEVAVASLHLTPHLRGTSGSLRGPLPTLSRCRGPRGGTPWSPALPLGTGVTDTCPAVTSAQGHPERPHLELREGPLLLCPPSVQKALGDLEGQRPQCPLLNVKTMPPTLAGPECTGPGLVPGGGQHAGLGTV